MKQILVTGGAGFIGSHLTPQLLAAGWKVTVLDDLSSGNRAYVPMEADFIEQDVRDPGALAQVFASNDFEAVVHFAAQTMVPVSLAKPVYDCELNVVATVELLEQCRVHGVRKVVFASSVQCTEIIKICLFAKQNRRRPCLFMDLASIRWNAIWNCTINCTAWNMRRCVLPTFMANARETAAKAALSAFLPVYCAKDVRCSYSAMASRREILFTPEMWRLQWLLLWPRKYLPARIMSVLENKRPCWN